MYFATLCSGSSGNSILVGEGKRNFLIDCGTSARSLLQNLDVININAQGIEGIIVTHEHVDHIKGVGVAARKLKIPIYATRGIWEEMESQIGKLAPEQRIEVESSFQCAGLDVKLFPTSHDSRESYGLRIENNSGRPVALGVATDTGMITEEMHRHLKGCEGLIVEANHDETALWQGSYPWHLKKRIAGNRGHLENKQLAEGLLEWIEPNTQRVVLAHLSAENNTPETALQTVARILKEGNVSKRCSQLRLRVAPRFHPHELIVLCEE